MDAYMFDVRGLIEEEKIMVRVLQGIVNRRGPRLFLWGKEGIRYVETDKKWEEYYRREKGFSFQEAGTIDNLLDIFSEDIKGLIVYDPKFDATKWVAVTKAGIESLLPVSPSMLRRSTPNLRKRELLWPGDNFSDLSGWEKPGHTSFETDGQIATLATSESPHGWVTTKYPKFDLDKYPMLEVKILSISDKTEGWGIEGYSIGEITLPSIQPKTTKAGTFRYNLKEVLGMEGRITLGQLDLKIWGNGGIVKFESIRVTSLTGDIPMEDEYVETLDTPNITVKDDFRGRWQDELEPYRWAIENLIPKCNRKVAHEIGGPDRVTGELPGLDFAVMRKGVIFSLAATGTEVFYGQKVLSGYPEHVKVFHEVMEALDPVAQVHGYGSPEGRYCTILSQHGHCSNLTHMDNLSFHAQVPCKMKEFKQKGRISLEEVKLEKKYYIAFDTPEGDAYADGPGTFWGGNWFDPDRGKVPINWGVNPRIAKEVPVLLEYFYNTATKNDYFFAGVSGAGYCYIQIIPNLKEFAEETGSLMDLADIDIVEIHNGDPNSNPSSRFYSPERLAEYAKFAKVKGFIHWNFGKGRTEYIGKENIPIIFMPSLLMYWDSKRCVTPASLAKQIELSATQYKPPFFLVAHGGFTASSQVNDFPTFLKRAMDFLDPKKYEAVTLETMVTLAKKAM